MTSSAEVNVTNTTGDQSAEIAAFGQMRSTPAMRDRLRELSKDGDDYDRGVLMVLDDLDMILNAVPADETELPTEDAALAYANGYVAGLEAARDQSAALLIKERDSAKAQCSFERALRQVMERRANDLAARIADLEDRLRAALTKAGAA